MKVSIASLRAVHRHLSEILDRCDAQKRAEPGKDNLLDDPSGVPMSQGIPGMDRLSQGHLSRTRK